MDGNGGTGLTDLEKEGRDRRRLETLDRQLDYFTILLDAGHPEAFLKERALQILCEMIEDRDG